MVGTFAMSGFRPAEGVVGVVSGAAARIALAGAIACSGAAAALAQRPQPGQMPQLGQMPQPGQAPQQIPGQVALKGKGIVNAVSDNLISAKLEKGEWMLTIGPDTTVQVTGSAEPDYLRPGLFVKFSGEIDKKGNLQRELSAVEIFTPEGKGGAGIFESGDANAKPVTKPAEGASYEFRGRVSLYKPGELNLTAGSKKIVAKTAPALTVAVNTSDLDLVQEGDSISVSGWYAEQQRPNPRAMLPGYATATTVTIVLSKPLESTRKARPALSKPSRSLKPPASGTPSPFGN